MTVTDVNDSFWQECNALTGNTAASVTLDHARNYLRISSAIDDIVYIKFNWATGDTEVSATNFDVLLTSRGSFEFKHEHPSAPKLKNVRVICATSGRLGFMGW